MCDDTPIEPGSDAFGTTTSCRWAGDVEPPDRHGAGSPSRSHLSGGLWAQEGSRTMLEGTRSEAPKGTRERSPRLAVPKVPGSADRLETQAEPGSRRRWEAQSSGQDRRAGQTLDSGGRWLPGSPRRMGKQVPQVNPVLSGDPKGLRAVFEEGPRVVCTDQRRRSISSSLRRAEASVTKVPSRWSPKTWTWARNVEMYLADSRYRRPATVQENSPGSVVRSSMSRGSSGQPLGAFSRRSKGLPPWPRSAGDRSR